jgi:hypothetical protein
MRIRQSDQAGDYRVFVTPEGDCRGLYVRRKSANSFVVRELMGGKSSVAFSYRIVGRRKDIKQLRRFAKIDMPLSPPTRAATRTAQAVSTAADLHAFVARVEKEARERVSKDVEKARAHSAETVPAFLSRLRGALPTEKNEEVTPPGTPTHCSQCNALLIEIDYYGQRLISCIKCNLWSWRGGERILVQLMPQDLEELGLAA